MSFTAVVFPLPGFPRRSRLIGDWKKRKSEGRIEK